MQEKARAYPEIEMGPPEVVDKRMAQYREEGFRHFQVKAGRGSNLDLDMARIRMAGECIQVGETLVVDGYLEPNEKPGLGVEPDLSILGEPVRTYG